MNCKKGDMAVTTFSHVPGNSGRVVEVLRWHGNERGHPCWWIRSAGSIMRNSCNELRMEGYFPDAYLRPVSGLSDTESTDEQREITQPQDSVHVGGGKPELIPV